jgi:osmotically-inducible protein OsmY
VATQPADASALADLDLYEAVVEAVEGLNIVREASVPLTITVSDGVVTVAGVVLTRIMRQAVLVTAALVPDVRKVIDRLHTDADIEIAISQALAADPGTQVLQPRIVVRSYRGDVTLAGALDDPHAIQAAEAIALTVPGVRSVTNHLT